MAEVGEMFLLQSHFGERIFTVGVKAGRNQKEVRVEFEQTVKRLVNNQGMLFRISIRWDGPVEDILSRCFAGTRITGILVNRSKPDPLVTENGRFSSVAVVCVEVPDGDPLAANRQSVVGGNGDRIQIAETHRSRLSGMMTGWAHQGKTFPTGQRQIDCGYRRPGRTPGVIFNLWIVGSIGVEIDRHTKALEMIWVMNSQYFRFRGQTWFYPQPVRVLIEKVSPGVDQPLRSLWMIILDKLSGELIENQSNHRGSDPDMLGY